jgi:hypothetical protein
MYTDQTSQHAQNICIIRKHAKKILAELVKFVPPPVGREEAPDPLPAAPSPTPLQPPPPSPCCCLGLVGVGSRSGLPRCRGGGSGHPRRRGSGSDLPRHGGCGSSLPRRRGCGSSLQELPPPPLSSSLAGLPRRRGGRIRPPLSSWQLDPASPVVATAGSSPELAAERWRLHPAAAPEALPIGQCGGGAAVTASGGGGEATS